MKTVIRFTAGYCTNDYWLACGHGKTIEDARRDLQDNIFQQYKHIKFDPKEFLSQFRYVEQKHEDREEK